MVIGLPEAKSHRLVELAECPVLVPELVAVLAPLRKLLIRLGRRRSAKGKGKPRKSGLASWPPISN